MAFSVSYIYKLVDQYSAPIDAIQRKTERLRQSVKGAAASMSTSMQKFADKTATANNALASLGAGVAIKKMLTSSMEIEDAMADIARVSNMSGDSLNNMRKELEALADKTGRPAVGLAKIAFEGGKLGTAEKDLIPFTTAVVKMAVAFDQTEESIGASVGSIKAKLGLSMDAVNDLADRINFLADSTSANGSRMIEIIERTSGSMKTLKMPKEAIAGLAAFADQLEVSPELAASGLNQMFARMMKTPATMKKLMQDPAAAVREEFEKFAKMPELQRSSMLFKKYGDEAGRFMLKVTSNMDLFDDTMGKAFSTGAIGSMDREMQNRAGRTSTIFAQAMESMTSAIARLGDTLKPVLAPIVKGIADFAVKAREFVQNNPRLAQFVTIMVSAAAIAVPLITVFGLLAGAFAALISPIGLIIGGVVAIVAWFTTMASSNDELASALGKLWQAFSPVIDAFAMAFGATGGLLEGIDIVDAMVWAINKLADAIKVIMTPFRAFVEMTKAFNAGGGISDVLGAGKDALMGGIKSAGSFFGVGGDGVAAQTAKAASGTVNGNIVVSAAPGAQVRSAEMNSSVPGNLGMNIAYGGR